MHIIAYINLSTYFPCLNCGRSLDFFLVPRCVQVSGLKRDHYSARIRSPRFFLDYNWSLIVLITVCFNILVFPWSAQAKKRRVILFFTNKFRSLVPHVIRLNKGHCSLLLLQIVKSRSWLIIKKSHDGRDINSSRRDRFNYYLETRTVIWAKKFRSSSNDQNLRRTLCEYRSMRAQLFPTLIKQFFRTLSLRKFAYEFAQHKEVPGDQLKPSKERIKNVNISNQQCRC